mmetsp:Transcript_8229/g.11953  ORF Transcript_8229/g.11953 Transcript_8229/m.11953 type:complete len:536 (+) Transcript_8229:46-1653(+)|eukprot:CAMPEP_0194217252 /NCGR_PEP_ID=MMETSP0156-20130528/20748_1 /TAXON_ID=33649 /ORGANISM="Thalassionema nitzschioides, Strain L26-B" /LENGTH=535 /DNA_ID=CAMNT_0038946241 /DNA_START=40 /DNA_END=1647 /DNA_ORIENTATION=+
MNYAEDRSDRKGRGSDIFEDFVQAIENRDHGLLGRTLRDNGWNRHAIFHFSKGIVDEDTLADYAQMAEFGGFPEIGILALLHYRRRGSFIQSCALDKWHSDHIMNPSWLQSDAPKGHCGCGFEDCGKFFCYVPMEGNLDPIFESLQIYFDRLPSRKMPQAHEILVATGKEEEFYFSECIPEILKFWETSSLSADILPLCLLSQMLLLKQAYQLIPALAAEAIVHMQVHKHRISKKYKSHNAYFVLIKAVILGDRIKPSRRSTMKQYHVPIWDVLWGHDGRIGVHCRWQPTSKDIVSHFQQCLEKCKLEHQPDEIPMKWLLTAPSEIQPLFLVGDSHILSIAWQYLQWNDSDDVRILIPVVVTGLKAWHCRADTRFFTHSLLQILLQRIQHGTNCILFSAGEIDCREGLGGPTLEGYETDIVKSEHVDRTVIAFVKALTSIPLKIWILPVAPHIHRSARNGKAVGRAARRYLTQLWNEKLNQILPDSNVNLLDYVKYLHDPGYVLKKIYNADGTHMNSAFLPLLENARKNSTSANS